ncbi:carboxylating nicotinate-nucleotide diphosphorylase [Candidatus Woesearchaeota archaeon]|nr:carboxylating nicotinate-nucleotide diphosphorylase [Candidatus Woesearchaeota archaeon]
MCSRTTRLIHALFHGWFLTRKSIIQLALDEDIGTGDITTEAILPRRSRETAVILAREDGIIAGLNVVQEIYKKLAMRFYVKDGDSIRAKQPVVEISGSARDILSRERVALNFLSHLSGIATEAHKYVTAVGGKATILDTRKTTPGLRKLEKYAVRMGGAQNHRLGLYDMVLIKDNHIKSAGSIAKAVALAREYSSKKIEVEIERLDQLQEALDAKPDILMLDNMSIKDMSRAVKIVDKRISVEASGNVTLSNVKEISKTGVDYISVGAITHSAKALDVTMEFK